MIICKTTKCISYPVCLHKKFIQCNDLIQWVKLGDGPIKDRWAILYGTFPNTNHVGTHDNSNSNLPLGTFETYELYKSEKITLIKNSNVGES